MISFIICSINPNKAKSVEENVRATIGIDCEFIIVDNRQDCRGICAVYNSGAKMAHNSYLCFLHEDVCFRGDDWGQSIVDKLSEPECGVIGFMGSVYKTKAPSGWNCIPRLNRSHFIQSSDVTSRKSDCCHLGFEPVLVLDGACMFVRKDLWQMCWFDDAVLSGFHCYDLDFCLSVAKLGYKNFVCSTVWLEHFSEGGFNIDWVASTLSLHRKWHQFLPMSNGDTNCYSSFCQNYIELRSFYVFLKVCIKIKMPRKYIDELVEHLPSGVLHPILWTKCYMLLRKIYLSIL